MNPHPSSLQNCLKKKTISLGLQGVQGGEFWLCASCGDRQSRMVCKGIGSWWPLGGLWWRIFKQILRRKWNRDDRSEQGRGGRLSPACPAWRVLRAHLHTPTLIWGLCIRQEIGKKPQNSGKIYKTFLKHMYSSCFHVLSLTLRHCLCPQFSAAATISVHHLSNFLLGNWIFRNFSHLPKGFTLSN